MYSAASAMQLCTLCTFSRQLYTQHNCNYCNCSAICRVHEFYPEFSALESALRYLLNSTKSFPEFHSELSWAISRAFLSYIQSFPELYPEQFWALYWDAFRNLVLNSELSWVLFRNLDLHIPFWRQLLAPQLVLQLYSDSCPFSN